MRLNGEFGSLVLLEASVLHDASKHSRAAGSLARVRSSQIFASTPLTRLRAHTLWIIRTGGGLLVGDQCSLGVTEATRGAN